MTDWFDIQPVLEFVVFVVGEEKTKFALLASFVASHSNAFKVLTQDRMKEAIKSTIELMDVDKDTFERYRDFAYQGDYVPQKFTQLLKTDGLVCVPTPRQTPLSENGNPIDAGSPGFAKLQKPDLSEISKVEDYFEVSKEPYDPWGVRGLIKNMQELPSIQKQQLWRKFRARSYDPSAFQNIFRPTCSVRYNKHGLEDYAPVLIGHAKVYIFADKYLIDNLKTLALHKLHETLVYFTLFKARWRDILKLTAFIYAEGSTRDLEDSPRCLRSLITEYIACRLQLLKFIDFDDALQEGGPFTMDLACTMFKLIKSLG